MFVERNVQQIDSEKHSVDGNNIKYPLPKPKTKQKRKRVFILSLIFQYRSKQWTKKKIGMMDFPICICQITRFMKISSVRDTLEFLRRAKDTNNIWMLFLSQVALDLQRKFLAMFRRLTHWCQIMCRVRINNQFVDH